MLPPLRDLLFARATGVASGLFAGLLLLCFLDLVHAGPGVANGNTPSSVAGSLKPPADQGGAMVPTAIAYSHIEALRNLMWDRNQRYRVDESARFRARLAQLGVGDADQAILFQGVWPTSRGVSIVAEYYGRATSPLGRALSMLKVRTAPREVSRAALVAMDSQVRAMLDAESEVLALAEQLQELNAQEFALRQQELTSIDRNALAARTFAVGYAATSCPVCDLIPANGELVGRYDSVAADGGRLVKLSNEVSALTTAEVKIDQQFRAMKLPFVAELGAQATPPTNVKSEPPDNVPADAVPD